jgi:dTDP-4-dehydrorhamnose 3,5-epimerase
VRVITTDIDDVLVFEPKVFGDERGYFFESFNSRVFCDAVGREVSFVQDNQSGSRRGVLRGLHYQVHQAQGKLVRVLAGEIYDVAVDIRKGSPNFGRWIGARLSSDNRHQIWVPEGFAHGFCVVSEFAEVMYKTTDFYAPEHERCIRWDDPALGIEWPLDHAPLVSDKDRRGKDLRGAEVFP